ncbi:Fe(3+) ions import ATP-binding protein FbpC [Candidatus Vecturithrix granuli]|uniref:Fe(3+) ions import ATP-binding protein FbpC n=1 Tax=Vecturithrix granuli TaxID=1499967 RepID=A0A081C814_VECG1|nr:Fe(3+) ions import ATP-binding protein FbpC [Candidatus Vecturithrix granuli]
MSKFTDTKTAEVKLEQITKRFGKVTAVNAVSLEIPHGKLITLLGPSGCGKTTILRMIAGLEIPTAGHIYLGGEDITHLPPNERKITMVFQSYALFPHMNVYENIAYGLRVMRWSEENIRAAIEEAVRMVGLKGLTQRASNELSGGQQQRVAVARALVLKPKVLLFDEPLSNLDAKLRKHMRGEIRNLQRDLGITSVYVTHDQSEALAISDQIVVMDNAVISQLGTPKELYTRPANPFVADFIGEANLLDVEVLDVEEQAARVRVDAIEVVVPYYRPPRPGEQAKLVIRPEDIRISTNEQKQGLKGVVKFAQYQGASNDYIIETAAGELSMNDYEAKEMLLDRGTPVSLTFRNDHLFLIC